MAKPANNVRCGVDVSKDTLDIVQSDVSSPIRLANCRSAIKSWLNTLPPGSAIALEATGSYHHELVYLAHERGVKLYLLDGYKLSKYREGVGVRAKTDARDAQLILRFITHEQEALTPWIPPPKTFYQIQSLLRRRAAVVKARIALHQSLSGLPELKALSQQLDTRLTHLAGQLTLKLKSLFKEAGWWQQAQRCQQIEGIGELTAMALANLFHRGHFNNVDAFIAYMGMDLRVRDSGKKRGQRCLTKKGDPEVRRLLYNAASSACRTTAWSSLYQSYKAQGMKPTQALVKLARKLARIAFALMKQQCDYRPQST